MQDAQVTKSLHVWDHVTTSVFQLVLKIRKHQKIFLKQKSPVQFVRSRRKKFLLISEDVNWTEFTIFYF